MKNDNPYGDDAGTRVGRPDTPQRDNVAGTAGDLHGSGDGGDLGAGKESTGGRSQHGTPETARPGSEAPDRKEEGDSGYGGNKGNPKQAGDRR